MHKYKYITGVFVVKMQYDTCDYILNVSQIHVIYLLLKISDLP